MYKMYSRVPGATRTHTAARCLCVSGAPFPSKVNSRRRRHNVRPAAMVGSLLGVSPHTPLRPWLHSEHVLTNNTCVFLSVPPAASTPAQGKVKDAGEMLFILASRHASAARLKDKLRSLEENMAAVCFMWLLLFCRPIFFSLPH